MEHQMHLYEQAFNLVYFGLKTIELRIYDDKRKQISVGDLITFINLTKPDETIVVRVISNRSFIGFHELFLWVNPTLCGWPDGISHADAANYMVNFYKQQDKLELLRKLGAVAIEFELV